MTVPASPRRQALVLVLANAIVSSLLLAGVEGALHLMLIRPGLIPGPALLDTMRGLYWAERWNDLIQFSPACAESNETLGYTLKSGHCTFSGTEFSNAYAINHLGLRDDDESLHQPEIVVLGDSFAMGWGVDQDQTFAQLIEQRTGRRTLNAGISSYGTAREIENLARIDRSHLRVLIVQYCDNDDDENRAYVSHGFHLDTMTARAWQTFAAGYHDMRQYWPGRDLTFLARMVRGAGGAPGPPGPAAPGALSDVEAFARVLEHAPIAFDDVAVFVVETTNAGRGGRGFHDRLVALQQQSPASALARVTAVDSAAALRPEHYYRLDGHLNAAGHAALASTLLDAIAQRGALPIN